MQNAVLLRRRRSPGQAHVEGILVVILVALAGVGGFTDLGRSARDAIAGTSQGVPASHCGPATHAAPQNPGFTAQAGVGAFARATEMLRAAARPLEAFDDATVRDLAPDMRRYAVKSDPVDAASLPAAWSKKPSAFGAPVQFGFELEGVRLGALLDWYKPEGAAGRAALRARPGDTLTHLRDNRFRTLTRKEGAPGALAADVLGELESEVFELRTTSPLHTQAELVDLVSQAHSRIGGSLQWHMSFVPDPAEAKRVTALLGHLDEYETLRQYAKDRRLIDNPYRGPFNKETLAGVERSLARGGTFHASDARKTRSVGFRTEIYGDGERVGFEFRGANHDVDDASRIIDEAVRALGSPADARISLRNGAPRSLDEIAGDYDRLSVYTTERLTKEQRTIFEEARPLDGDPQRAAPMQERWALPLVRWEERPWLAARADEIEAARALFLTRVDSLAKEPHSYQFKRLNEALSEWAHSLKLHEDY